MNGEWNSSNPGSYEIFDPKDRTGAIKPVTDMLRARQGKYIKLALYVYMVYNGQGVLKHPDFCLQDQGGEKWNLSRNWILLRESFTADR